MVDAADDPDLEARERLMEAVVGLLETSLEMATAADRDAQSERLAAQCEALAHIMAAGGQAHSRNPLRSLLKSLDYRREGSVSGPARPARARLGSGGDDRLRPTGDER